MSVLNENTLIGASAAGGYDIPNSLRFNDDDSAYLSRTPSSAGNRKTWTFSAWVKRGNIGLRAELFSANATTPHNIRFNGDALQIFRYSGGYTWNVITAQLFRDTSAWYHIVVAYDTTQSTAADRVIVYVNGVVITSYSTAVYPGLDTIYEINSAAMHTIGTTANIATHHDGYLSEVNFIDGQALTPDDFGEFGDYGEWLPKKYAGTYGTNGFYLDFKDSGTLGNDAAGSNNWTPTNLAATDQMLDSPTNNFATWNPINNTSTGTFKEGNLYMVEPGTVASYFAQGTFGLSSGKWYFEANLLTPSSNGSCRFGVSKNNGTGASDIAIYNGTGQYEIEGTTTTGKATYSTGAIIGCALDLDSNTIEWFNNSTSQGSVSISATEWTTHLRIYAKSGLTVKVVANFGQDSSFAGNKTAQGNSDSNGIGDFYYAPPTGFLALCTKNLPDATVVPSEHFNTVLYTGNGSTNAITGVGFQSDFTWLKKRNGTSNHLVVDAVRGDFKIYPNLTNSEDAANDFDSFDSDGFTVSSTSNNSNASGSTYAAWNWKAGGTGVSNTDGSITSSVSANVDAGFSVVSYTGNVTAGATVGHGLSIAPEMVIVKNRDQADKWAVYASSLTATTFLSLNQTSAAVTSSLYWNNTEPTSSVFSLGTTSPVNATTEDYIAYAFHSVDGYSKVGSYTGNGSDDGTFVYTGFRPAYVMIKRTDGTGNWDTMDTARDIDNVVSQILRVNTSGAEITSGGGNTKDYLSNGFKLKGTGSDINASGGTYIYLAFAESPFKHSNAR